MRAQGCAVDQIATAMHLSPLRILRLLEAHDDRGGLGDGQCDTVAVTVVRDLFEAWRAIDPKRRTYRELARLVGYDSSSVVQRLLGVIATSPVTNRGVHYPGRIQTRISCENAARLVRAMGHLPCDIPGL
jgi:hypothetical protein